MLPFDILPFERLLMLPFIEFMFDILPFDIFEFDILPFIEPLFEFIMLPFDIEPLFEVELLLVIFEFIILPFDIFEFIIFELVLVFAPPPHAKPSAATAKSADKLITFFIKLNFSCLLKG